MYRIQNLTFLTVLFGLFLSTMAGSVSVDAAIETYQGQTVSQSTTGSAIPESSVDASKSELSQGLNLSGLILWTLGLGEAWLGGWLCVWSVALFAARRFLINADASMRNVTLGRIPFSRGMPFTLAHLTLVRAFAQHSRVIAEWVGQHSRAVHDWLSIGSDKSQPEAQDLVVRVDGQAIAIADAPTVRAMLPESPFVLAFHDNDPHWCEQVLHLLIRQAMDEEKTNRLMPHQTIPVLLDRNCVERLKTKGQTADGLPLWLQVIRNELCRIPGIAARLDDELLQCLVKTRQILPIADQWDRLPVGIQSALLAAVSAGDLPCLVVFGAEDSVVDMQGVIRAHSLNSSDIDSFNVPVRSIRTEAIIEQRPGQRNTPTATRGFDKNSVPMLVQSLSDSDAEVRLAAAQELGRLGADAVSAAEQLTTMLNDSVTICRLAAVNALGAIGPDTERSIRVLAEVANKDHRKVRAAACRALGAIGTSGEQALKALAEALTDKDANVRSQAARSLGILGAGQPEVTASLKSALTDESAEVRARVVAAISTIPEALNHSVPEIVSASTDQMPEVRREVASALGRTERSRTAIVQALAHSLADPDSETRSRAATSLAAFGQESRTAIPQLAKLVTDSDLNVRRSVIEALDSIGVPSLESVSALEEATRDDDALIRENAISALERVMPTVTAA